MPCGGDPSQAVIGKGATLGLGTKVSAGTAGTTFTDVEEINSIDKSGITTGEEDITTLQSPGGFSEYIPTNSDPGTVDVAGNYIAGAGQLAVRTAAYPDGTTCRVEPYWWQITNMLADGSIENRVFAGFVKTYKDAAPLSPTTKVEFSFQIRVTGSTTLTTTPAPGGLGTTPTTTQKKAA